LLGHLPVLDDLLEKRYAALWIDFHVEEGIAPIPY